MTIKTFSLTFQQAHYLHKEYNFYAILCIPNARYFVIITIREKSEEQLCILLIKIINFGTICD